MGLAGMVNFNPVADTVTESVESIAAHVNAGIVDLDMADMYPGVEEVAGSFLRHHFADGAAPRSSVRILTKFVPDKKLLSSLDADFVRRIVQRSCNRLGVDCVERVQLHWWDYDAPGYELVGEALAALCKGDEPLLKEVGLTNTDTANARKLTDAGVVLASVQVQYSLIDRRPAATMAPFCAEVGAELLAYGALGGGFLTEKWLGAADPTAEGSATAADVPASSKKYLALIVASGGWAPFQATLAACKAVAAELGAAVTVAQVALAWVLAQPGVGGAIVGGKHARHVPATTAATALTLSAAQLATLSGAAAATGCGYTGLAGDCYAIERDTSTPSGAALAPWTDVGTLGKPAHFEELKRRVVELEAFYTAAGVAAGPTGVAVPVSGVTPRAVLWVRTLAELRQNFGGAEGAEKLPVHVQLSRAALSEDQHGELLALESKLCTLAGLGL